MLSYSPPMSEIVPSVGSSTSPQRLAVEREAFQQRVRILLVAGEQLAADDVQRREHGVGLRNDFAPVLARRASSPEL